MFAGLLLPAGAFVDRYGRKAILLARLVVFFVNSASTLRAAERALGFRRRLPEKRAVLARGLVMVESIGQTTSAASAARERPPGLRAACVGMHGALARIPA